MSDEIDCPICNQDMTEKMMLKGFGKFTEAMTHLKKMHPSLFDKVKREIKKIESKN